MIPENRIKELISLKFIELIANYNGHPTSIPHSDFGTDLDVKEVDYRIENGQKRYFETGKELKLQIKSTTEKNIISDNYFIKYHLESKTFNDIIIRRKTKKPLILILFIFPEDKNEWINITDNELIAKKCAYWFFPKDNENQTDNISTRQIAIDKNNLITKDTLNFLFEQFSE